MKNGLGNLAADTVGQLTAIVRTRLNRIQYRPALINGFLAPDRAHPGTSVKIRPWPFKLCSQVPRRQTSLIAAPIRATSVKRAYEPGPVTTRAAGLG